MIEISAREDEETGWSPPAKIIWNPPEMSKRGQEKECRSRIPRK